MTSSRTTLVLAGLLAAGLACPAAADEGLTVEIHGVSKDGVGDAVGSILFEDTEYGLVIQPALEGIEPGLHGLHVHANPDCGPGPDDSGDIIAAGAAAGHHDPDNTGIHEGPYREGHLGDLPNLYVDQDGNTPLETLAPRVTVADLQGRAIVIHAGADDYTNAHPGGSRAYCGVVE